LKAKDPRHRRNRRLSFVVRISYIVCIEVFIGVHSWLLLVLKIHKNLQIFTKMHKTTQIRIRKEQILAFIRVHSWFPLKKQSQLPANRPEIRITKF